MHHIRIVQRGFIGHTGDFGGVHFVDGVSVEPLGPVMIDRIGASIAVETLDGESAGPVARTIAGRSTAVAEITASHGVTEEQFAKLITAIMSPDKPSVIRIYTMEEVEAIVDKDGIAGLREIAAPYGVKGRSIPDLVDAFMKAQAAAQNGAVIEPLQG